MTKGVCFGFIQKLYLLSVEIPQNLISQMTVWCERLHVDTNPPSKGISISRSLQNKQMVHTRGLQLNAVQNGHP